MSCQAVGVDGRPHRLTVGWDYPAEKVCPMTGSLSSWDTLLPCSPRQAVLTQALLKGPPQVAAL